MSAKLKLIAAALAPAQRPARIPSPRQQEITANLSLIARTWPTLSDSQRQSFTDFGQTWSPIPGKATASGFVVFQALNGVRLSASLADILRDAPLRPDFLGKLPPFAVTATVAAPPALTLRQSAPDADSGFALTLAISAVGSPVRILATRPLSPGVTRPKPGDFRQIGVYSSLDPVHPNDLTAAYLAHFAAPTPGFKIGLQLIPVTVSGFQGSPFTQTITVTPAP